MSTVDTPIIIKFAQVSEQTTPSNKRIIGLVKARNFATVISAVDLEANPRSSKTGSITDSIRESLEETPDTFPSKTKGILIGASLYRALERRRYEVDFIEPGMEGILDGGHNALAIGIHIMKAAGIADPKLDRKGLVWSDFKELWDEHDAAITTAVADAERATLDVLVPIELLVPTDPDDDAAVSDFSASLLEICAARNNNVQLKAEAKVNQEGLFDTLKELLPPQVATAVEWKQNTGGRIKPGDVVALSWIPLMLLDLPKGQDGRLAEAPAPQKIYSSKGDCIYRFERLMSSSDVTTQEGDKGFRRTLVSDQVHSAFKITARLVELYDVIYAQLPDAYNRASGSFGRINAVAKLNSTKAKYAKFTGRKVNTAIPEGFIVPLVFGLQALMKVDENGCVQWSTDPDLFLKEHFEQIVLEYKSIITMLNYDPQRIGKSADAYRMTKSAFEMQLYRSRI